MKLKNGGNMRGVHSAVDNIRRSVFTEVAKLAYETEDYRKVDEIPYNIIPGEKALHRADVFIERAIISARTKLAIGMDIDPRKPISSGIGEAATDHKYFKNPLVNVIPFACNACPPKQIRITDSCQGCISHPCLNICPKDAIYVDENKHCHIDQEKCIKCGKCFSQCPYHAISKIERPCAEACGMDAIGSDELGRAKIDYDKCVSCGMCIVNCPFGAIADKSQIFQVITAMKRQHEVIACVAPAFIGQFGKNVTPSKLKKAMRKIGFSDVVEVAVGADLCTVAEAHDFLDNVPEKIPFMGTSCCPAWSMMAKKMFPEFKECISMALTPMVLTARMVKKDNPDAMICFVGPCSAKKLEANRRSVRSDVDFVLTFEEVQGMFDAKNVNFDNIKDDESLDMNEGTAMGRGFAVGSGVAAAVVEAIKHIDPDREVLTEYGDGLLECRKILYKAKTGKYNGYLIEGMGCPGGCIAGAGTITPVKDSQINVARYVKEAKLKSSTESGYIDRLEEVEEKPDETLDVQ
jgi:[FeFe] hydrogenase (group B1/B3)